MPWHDWSSNFDFGRLNQAGKYLSRLYNKITKENMIWKEKYGTIRYELASFWIHTDTHAEIFHKCAKRTIKRFPDVGGEIAEDLIFTFNNPEWEAFYKGVVHLHDALNKGNEEHYG